MSPWYRRASRISRSRRRWKGRGSSPNRAVQHRGDERGRVSLHWVLAIGVAIVIIEYYACKALRNGYFRAAHREAEWQQRATDEEDEIAAGNDYAGAVVISVNGFRDDNHHSAAKRPRAALTQAAGAVDKSAKSTAPRAHAGGNGSNEPVAENVAGNLKNDSGNLEKTSGTSVTLTRLREGECTAKDCRVLITGCGRSGTHFLAEELADAGVPINHETIGTVGTVSWIHAAPFRTELAEQEEWLSDAPSVKLRSSPHFRFFPIFHLVRHPLAVIASLTECFCGCGSMSCGRWADNPSWRWAGNFVGFSNRQCYRMQGNDLCIQHDNAGGRLIRSMEYWVRWNYLVGAQAHYRVQLETLVLSEMVAAVPQLYDSIGGADAAARIEQRPFVSKRAKRGKPRTAVTWKSMRLADPALESKIWEMAQSYGYSRDLP